MIRQAVAIGTKQHWRQIRPLAACWLCCSTPSLRAQPPRHPPPQPLAHLLAEEVVDVWRQPHHVPARLPVAAGAQEQQATERGGDGKVAAWKDVCERGCGTAGWLGKEVDGVQMDISTP